MTAQKAAEQALHEQGTRLQDIAASIPGAVYQFEVRPDDSWKILFMNDAAADLFERPAQELTDVDCMVACICPEDREILHVSIEESRRTLSPWACEFRVVTPGGRTKWLRGASRPRNCPDGTILWSGVLLDITSRRRAEEEIQRQNDLAQSYLDVAAVMMVAIGADQQVALVNKKACEILGCTAEEAMGQDWFDTFVPQDDRERTKAAFRDLIADRTELAEYLENQVLTRTGQERLIAWHNTVLRDDQGQIVATLSSGEDITERRRAQEALQASEAKYRAVVETSLVGIGISKDDRIVYANRSLLRMYGYTDFEEFAAKSLLDYLASSSRMQVQQWRQRYQRGENVPSVIEHDIVRKDGTIRTLQVTVSHVAVHGCIYAHMVFVDVTVRKRAAAALRESEKRFRSLIEGAPEAIFVQSQGRFVYLNPGAVQLFGATGSKELLGQDFMERIAPEYHSAIRERIRQQQETQRPVAPMEQEYLRLDGSRVPVETAAVSTCFHGRDAHLVFIRDITERKAAEGALRASEERFRRVFEESSIGMALTSRELKIVQVNPAFCRMLGYTPEEMYTLTILNITHPEHHNTDRENIERLWQGEIACYRTEKRYLAKSGDVRWGSLSVSLVRDQAGTPLHALAIVEDITERKQAAALLEIQRDLAVSLGAIHDLGQGLHLSLQAAISASELDCGGIYLRDEARGSLELVCHVGLSEDFVRDTARYGPDALNAQVVSTGRPIYADYPTLGLPLDEIKGREGLRAIAIIPLFHREQVVGFLNVASRRLAEVPPYARTMLEAIASQIGGTITRLKAERALRESEATYRTLVAGLPDIVMRFDRSGRHLFASDNVEQVVPLTAAQFFGKTHRELGFPEAQCQLWEEAIRRVFDSRVPFETEFVFEGKRGPVFFNWRLLPELDANGVVQSVLSISRDITKHRRLEQDYHTIFRQMLNGFAIHEIICDAQDRPVDYRFLAVNPTFERLTGLKAQDVVGRTVREVLPGTEPRWIETYGRVALTGEPVLFKDYHNGLAKHFEVAAFCPRPRQFACIFADITERQRAQEALQTSENRFRSYFELGLIGMAITSPTKGIVEVNDEICRILGYERTELQQMNWGQLTHPEDLDGDLVHFHQVLAGSLDGYSIEKRFMRKDGQTIYATISVKCLRRQDGSVDYFVALLQDITEQKRAQEQAKQREAELLHVTRVSTLGEMASGIAHELNQPLAAIANFGFACLCLLRSPTPDVPRIVRNLEMIVSQSERAGQIIRKMRSLIKNTQAQFVSVDLNEVIASVLALVRSELTGKSVQLKLELSEPLPRIHADVIQMEQVLLNLTRNAVEAMNGVEEHSRRLTIRTKAVDGDKVRMEVCDTGTGLPEGEPERIFGPFFTTKTNGLGLGLPISRSIVQAHHGELTAVRNPDRGSTFSITLPRSPIAEPLRQELERPRMHAEIVEENSLSWPILTRQDVFGNTLSGWKEFG